MRADLLESDLSGPLGRQGPRGVEYATAGWVEWFNNQRLHSAIQMRSPMAFENAYSADLTLVEEKLV